MCLATACCSGIGMAGLIPSNKLSVSIMLVFRLLQGVANLNGMKMITEGCNVWFPEKYRLVLGIVNGGGYTGIAVANVLGSSIYQYCENWTITFLVTGGICAGILLLNLCVLPNKEKSLLSASGGAQYGLTSDTGVDIKCDEKVGVEDNKQDSLCDLTALIVFPMIVTFTFELIGGYTGSIVSLYLTEVAGTSVSQGGVYVMILNLAMGAGSVMAGLLLQHKILSSAQMISISALIVGLGMWVLFPGQAVGFLHDNIQVTANGAVTLIGCGAVMGEMAAFKAMEDLQVIVFKRGMGAKNRSVSSGLFFIMISVGYSSGNSICVVVLDYLSYEQGAFIILGCTGVVLLIGVVVEVLLRRHYCKDSVLVEY